MDFDYGKAVGLTELRRPGQNTFNYLRQQVRAAGGRENKQWSQSELENNIATSVNLLFNTLTPLMLNM